MGQKPITVVVSDLHVGGGPADPGDDHIYQGGEFSAFLDRELPESADGRVELFINGDFLEFAQVLPGAYEPLFPKFWCSEGESLAKVDAVIAGHPEIFDSLRDFAGRGNDVTIAAGNHDVDFWWPAVRRRLEERIGRVEFALGDDWYSRYGGRMLIGHGHKYDVANRFRHWDNPVLTAPDGSARLEMCPGTLLMVKFINSLEERFPFADNLKPLTMLARVLFAEARTEFYAALWTLASFAGNHFTEFLNADAAGGGELRYGDAFIAKLDQSDAFAGAVAGLYAEARGRAVGAEELRGELTTEEAVCSFLADVVLKVEPARWQAVLDLGEGGVSLGIGGDPSAKREVMLSAVRSGMTNDKLVLRRAAELQFDVGVREVVVCGHTHQPDEWRGPNGTWDGGYFNPGSWTRYVDAEKAPRLKLEDLKREEDFPYELNYVRVEQSAGGRLRGDKVLYKRGEGRPLWS